jgi:hypothetical protein
MVSVIAAIFWIIGLILLLIASVQVWFAGSGDKSTRGMAMLSIALFVAAATFKYLFL